GGGGGLDGEETNEEGGDSVGCMFVYFFGGVFFVFGFWWFCFGFFLLCLFVCFGVGGWCGCVFCFFVFM
ncbi:hypothetical protein, partial [Campylobacter jejuni]|uniref:hypothetical protein n=1 Tax=Campylobacter jejuni TaxID=197 RepID=UPI0022427CB0